MRDSKYNQTPSVASLEDLNLEVARCFIQLARMKWDIKDEDICYALYKSEYPNGLTEEQFRYMYEHLSVR